MDSLLLLRTLTCMYLLMLNLMLLKLVVKLLMFTQHIVWEKVLMEFLTCRLYKHSTNHMEVLEQMTHWIKDVQSDGNVHLVVLYWTNSGLQELNQEQQLIINGRKLLVNNVFIWWYAKHITLLNIMFYH